jgi:hypothetical protein
MILPRFLRLLLLGFIAASLFGLQPAQGASGWPVAPPTAALLLDQRDPAGLAWLSAVGAQRLADYGAFSLWQLPASQANRAAFEQPSLRRAATRIQLRGMSIDTALAQPEPSLPATLRATATAGPAPRLWMVQFAGPLQPAWLNQLRSAGQTVAGCLPAYTCILWGPDASAPLQSLDKLVRWSGPFHPAYRLHPDLRPAGSLRLNAVDPLQVTLQFLNVPEAATDLAVLKTLAQVNTPPHPVLNYLNLRASVPAANLDRLAALPTLFNLEPYSDPVKNDEMQAQILAGQLANSPGALTASGPGYLAWLAAQGFSTNPNDYPIVDVVDDGIDNGTTSPLHLDFYANPASEARVSRISFQHSCLADNPNPNGVEGHGNINAGILAGYNADGGGMPYQDAAGFAFGLGISPYGRIAGSKIFGPGFSLGACGSSYTGLVSDAYSAGAQITSNSWGSESAFGYDSGAQEYDALTRDASPDTPGDQEMLNIFSAGNKGSSATTVGSPGTAKNVLTVGATDLPRDISYIDGCNVPSSASAANIAFYSSRGPTGDGRAKPELVAPGTHIQGPASQDSAYSTTAPSICGGAAPNKHYYPPQQILYTMSDGTSHAAPAVSGAVQLAWERYTNLFGQPNPPSPAMLKALLLNTPRYLDGVSSGGNLPSMSQGWGMPDLNSAFDTTTRYLRDQTTIFTSSGDIYAISGTIPDPSKPFHVTLVWSDAPGTTVGAALVNDLDLEVTVGGVTYLGNVFTGANSSAGGAADDLNNVENVFLPAGSGTSFTIRVLAHNIAGDGVPAYSGATDQDFALVAYNAKMQPAPIFSFLSYDWQEDPAASNHNQILEAGETANLTVTVNNLSEQINASAVTASLQLLPTQASVLSTQPMAYPDIAHNASAANQTPFRIHIQPGLACPTPIVSMLHLDYRYIITLPPETTAAIDLPLPPFKLCDSRFYLKFFPWLMR